MVEEKDFEKNIELDLGSGHMAYCHASFVDLYLHHRATLIQKKTKEHKYNSKSKRIKAVLKY